MEDQARELRRIRITLIVLVIVTLISGGNSDVSVNYPNYDFEGDPQQNVIQLGDGRFGIITDGEYMMIYEYDAEKNKIKKVNDIELYELD
ncbi:hypothetical protein J6TS1_41360 [Siminovitchia terrae]|uniref:Uncharacterized protein n=1 Tax=Siminovitchia terrae TaxID=1914933 RepID=A0A429X3E6_SIMTE|nr:hypothetical protein [Siminovitchia terrae]RST57891.1 hypothetical protein D5F11_020550 [Siminovitchia terrae]GIN92108.1 hypothetical protein J22TS1_31590 [Siminovitchia terrae]GIN98266.1 hypothetical protein J6TS1_41360 [Siminovitchia terrae]